MVGSSTVVRDVVATELATEVLVSIEGEVGAVIVWA
jgi:hypothetical protein